MPKGAERDTRPSIASVRVFIFAFRHHLFFLGRAKKFEEEAGRTLRAHLRKLLEDGTLTDAKQIRYITDPGGLLALARATTSPLTGMKAPRSKPILMLFMSIEIQMGTRGAAHMAKSYTDDLPAMTYSCFVLVVGPSEEGRNSLSLQYKPPRSKTKTTKDSVLPLRETPERWRCPVTHFLTLAQLDGVLPFTVEEILAPAFLAGSAGDRTVAFNGPNGDKVIFRNINGEPYTTSGMSRWLARLSRVIGFTHPLGLHSFRHLLAFWMRLKADVQAAVQGSESTTDQLIATISLHPHVLKANPSATIALSAAHRCEILQHPDRGCLPLNALTLTVEAIKSKISRGRTRARNRYGNDMSRWPSKVKNDMKKLWGRLDSNYRRLYKNKIEELNGSSPEADEYNAIDNLPADGEAVEFDIDATEDVLGSIDIDTVGDLGDFIHSVVSPDDLDLELDQEPLSVPQAPDDLDLELDQEPLSVPQPPDAQALGLVPASGPPSHFEPLRAWRESLFDGESDIAEVIRLGVEAVERLQDSRGTRILRPGHSPSSGQCRRCGVQLPGGKHWDDNLRYATHVHKCEAAHAIAMAAPTLLSRYKSTDIPFPEPRGPKGNRWASTDQNVYQILKSVIKRRRPIRCVCDQDFDSARLLKEHLLLEHDVYLPQTAPASEQARLQKDVAKGVWDQGVARFTAIYWLSDERYHVDPREQQLYAKFLLDSLFAVPSKPVKFGLRKDLTSLTRTPDADTYSGNGNVDVRYCLRDADDGRRCDGFCIICINDHYSDSTTRATPLSFIATSRREHVLHHLLAQFAACRMYRQYKAAHDAFHGASSTAPAAGGDGDIDMDSDDEAGPSLAVDPLQDDISDTPHNGSPDLGDVDAGNDTDGEASAGPPDSDGTVTAPRRSGRLSQTSQAAQSESAASMGSRAASHSKSQPTPVGSSSAPSNTHTALASKNESSDEQASDSGSAFEPESESDAETASQLKPNAKGKGKVKATPNPMAGVVG
ncbi:hypothetical protein A1Q1_07946 [Trichosporon asahii var. asahii CBS 2479]|uniref:Uncharacterized protein n=1 Tax=Trichosporon asahii var. asahii (strain ATCC 90039 / CBS 2479 / JCM 2466 / KCTC 7840 / NBRC 103889/ NCYC 2677 / UAMH 7654) TaxID=1186058 RepID=J6F1P6_TRIAS|nr:hypothetical protein A1Q1_07946 [Trichosporon asahii var. asahii CBS 2479]EJT50884.1 hypothetical protein A1Q1_07946 [Trichosporon asahii var. asahii CBS 2479]